MDESNRRHHSVPDDLPGFIYSKNGEPIVQMQFEERRYGTLGTVFWRAHATAWQTLLFFGRMLEDAAHLQAGHSFFRPREAVARFLTSDAELLEQEISLPKAALVGDWTLESGTEGLLPRSEPPVVFARFDALRLETPLIVWADLYQSYYAEIGVTCSLIPKSLYDFLAATRPDLTKLDLTRLEESLGKHLGAHAWATV